MDPLAELGAIARRARQSESPKVTIPAMADRIGIGQTKLASFELGKDPLSPPLQAKIERYFGWKPGTIARASDGIRFVEGADPASDPPTSVEIVDRVIALLTEVSRQLRGDDSREPGK